jgi:hypothetical protein
MELFLNFFWALIAILTVCLWRRRWMREQRDGHREPLREWTAIACALVLLFFAVSLSDDLHAEVMLSDDCFTGRRHSSCMHASQDSGAVVRTLTAAVLPVIPSLQSLRQSGRVGSLDPLIDSFVRCIKQAGRAPPSSSL